MKPGTSGITNVCFFEAAGNNDVLFTRRGELEELADRFAQELAGSEALASARRKLDKVLSELFIKNDKIRIKVIEYVA